MHKYFDTNQVDENEQVNNIGLNLIMNKNISINNNFQNQKSNQNKVKNANENVNQISNQYQIPVHQKNNNIQQAYINNQYQNQGHQKNNNIQQIYINNQYQNKGHQKNNNIQQVYLNNQNQGYNKSYNINNQNQGNSKIYNIHKEQIHYIPNKFENSNSFINTNEKNYQNNLQIYRTQNEDLNKDKSKIYLPKEKLNKIEIKNLNKNKNLTNEEIEKAKENGYILIGKTGVGKTSLLNILYGENIGIVGYSSKSETNVSNYYCIKDNIDSDYIYFCIVDTPGLYDTNGREKDKGQKEDIIKLVSEEKIKVRGIFFLSNFQNERFDSSEQNTLIEYNAIFPLKEFWNRIILIFTHYYGDPDGDSVEEIKQRADNTLSNIFKIIMNKVKNVSTPVNFEKINKKYINIYSKAKNNIQIEKNRKIRKELINEIIKYNKLAPMFNKLQIFNFEKYQLKPDDNKLYDFDFYIYLDSLNHPVHEELKIHKVYEKNKNFLKEQKINLNIEDCDINEEGHLIKKNKKKDFLKEIFHSYKGEGLTAISIIGSIFTGIFCAPALPLCLLPFLGGGYYLKKKKDKKEKKKQEINNILLEENIIELIREKIYKKY